MESLPKLKEMELFLELFYSVLNILEVMWKIAKSLRRRI
jgi:hypothetical protein